MLSLFNAVAFIIAGSFWSSSGMPNSVIKVVLHILAIANAMAAYSIVAPYLSM